MLTAIARLRPVTKAYFFSRTFFNFFFISAGDSLVTVESTLFKFAERVRNLVVQRLDSEAETEGAPGKLTTT